MTADHESRISYLEESLARTLDALRSICQATGEETYEAGELIWQEADLVLRLHDKWERVLPAKTQQILPVDNPVDNSDLACG